MNGSQPRPAPRGKATSVSAPAMTPPAPSRSADPPRATSSTSLISRLSASLGTVIFGKTSRVLAAFVSFHFLQDKVALPYYLFFVCVGASLVLLALQRPWNGRRIGPRRGRKVVLAGALLALTLYIWTAGLRSAGPLRTLLMDGAELPLLYLFAVANGRELPERRRTRGAAMMLGAYAMLVWDASGHAPDLRRIESTRLGRSIEQKLEHLSSNKMLTSRAGGAANATGEAKAEAKGSGTVRDAFVEGTPLRREIGVVLVLVASLIMQSSRSFSRRLATELGGAKRHFALSITCATFWLAPLAFVSSLSTATGALLSLSVFGGVTRIDMSAGHYLGFAGVGLLWLVVPYYVRAIVSSNMSHRRMLQSGVVIPFVIASGISLAVGADASAGGVSWLLVVAFGCASLGISLMTAGGSKRSLSELPLHSGNEIAVERSAQ